MGAHASKVKAVKRIYPNTVPEKVSSAPIQHNLQNGDPVPPSSNEHLSRLSQLRIKETKHFIEKDTTSEMAHIMASRSKLEPTELLSIAEKVSMKITRFSALDLIQFFHLHQNKQESNEMIRKRFGFSLQVQQTLILYFNAPHYSATLADNTLSNDWINNESI